MGKDMWSQAKHAVTKELFNIYSIYFNLLRDNQTLVFDKNLLIIHTDFYSSGKDCFYRT